MRIAWDFLLAVFDWVESPLLNGGVGWFFNTTTFQTVILLHHHFSNGEVGWFCFTTTFRMVGWGDFYHYWPPHHFAVVGSKWEKGPLFPHSVLISVESSNKAGIIFYDFLKFWDISDKNQLFLLPTPPSRVRIPTESFFFHSFDDLDE